MQPGSTDVELVERWKCGDDDAFKEIVVRYRPLLWGIASRLLHHQEDAKDALQEALFSAYSKVNDLQRPEALKGWLATTTVRKCRDVTRSRPPRPVEDSVIERALHATLDSPDGIRGVELQLAMEELDDEERLVLVLRTLIGMSRSEVAEILDISENVVTNRLASARLRVAQALGYVRRGGPPGQGSGR